jgi:hypothetical protein
MLECKSRRGAKATTAASHSYSHGQVFLVDRLETASDLGS